MKTPKSLQELYPTIADEWCYKKNNYEIPSKISAGSSKKVWWKCKVNPEHVWAAVISSRTRGSGCPFCSGRVVLKEKSLGVKRPDVAIEWHTSKNGDLSPFDVGVASNKKVWWKCNVGIDHEWQAKISNRTSLNHGCSVCNNLTIVKSNCLATTHPKLSKEWDFKKNSKTPSEVVAGSHTKYWWKCTENKSHPSYLSAVNKRVYKRNCPICGVEKRGKSKSTPKAGKSFGDLYPELLSEWIQDENGKITPFNINASSPKKVWWQCPKGDDHIWYTQIRSRANGMGCSICRGLKVVNSNCLATTHPYLLAEWHPTKNKNITPSEIHYGSHKKIWWFCNKNSEHPDWQAAVKDRTQRDFGCNLCLPTLQSKEELIILFELKWIFNSIESNGAKLFVSEKKFSVDIFIQELNLIIEYDGYYWHKDKEKVDKQKTIALTNAGYNIIRLRQMPLSRIFDTDIMVPMKYDGKKICDQIMNYILINYKLKKDDNLKIKKYLNSKSLKNKRMFQIYLAALRN